MEIKKVVGINVFIISIILIAYGLGIIINVGGSGVYFAIFVGILAVTLIIFRKKNKELMSIGLIVLGLMVIMYIGKLYCIVYICPIIILISLLYKIIIAGKIDKTQKGILIYKIISYVLLAPCEIIMLTIYIIFFKAMISMIIY